MIHLRRILAIACLIVSGPLFAADTYQLDIDSQPLTTALQQFAQQSGLQIVYYGKIAEKHNAARIAGKLTADQALKLLLAGTDLQFETLDAYTVAISAAGTSSSVKPTAQVPDHGVVQLAKADASASTQNTANQKSDSSAEKDSGSVQEIIVTAQKREERLQDVPISITVLQGQDLDKSVQGLTDALSRVPGVAIQDGTSGLQILTIRGATGPGVGAGSSPIGYYLDSAPFGFFRHSMVPEANVYDLERVEVLRGPQGTLYGATSQNGVVRVLTKDANLNKFEAKMRGAVSSTTDGGDNYRGDLAVNVPIIEGKLAIRAVGSLVDRSGWIDRPNHKDANNQDSRSARLKIAAQPSEKLSIGLSAWTSGRESDANSNGIDRQTPSKVDEPNDSDYNVFALKADYDFPAFSLTSSTSYLDYRNIGTFDNETSQGPASAGVILTTRFDSKVFAEEVSLNSTHEGPWRWSLGAIYRNAEDHFLQWRRNHVNPNGNRFRDESESEAVYGMLTRLLMNDRLELSGGLRYFQDSQVTTELSNSGNPNAVLVTRTADFDAVSPRAVATWHATNDIMTYLSYSEGFRSGYPQAPYLTGLPLNYPPVNGDDLANYELGTKSSFLNGRLTVDAAVFYMDWQDIQQQIQIVLGTGTVVAGVNGVSASGMGAEIAISLRPTDRLELSANYAQNDLVMDADVVQPNGAVLFRKGDRTINSPETNAGIAATYSFPLGGGGYEGYVSAGANYVSQREARAVVNGVVATKESGVMQTALLRAGVDSPKGWGVMAFVDNLTDEDDSPDTGQFSSAPFAFLRIQPRTVGLQMEYRF